MKWENGEKEREGEEKKLGRQGGLTSLACQTRESLPRETKGRGGRWHFSCELRELAGLLHTSDFSTGFANGHYKVEYPVLLWVWPGNTVLIMPLLLSHHSLEEEDG